MDTNIAKVLLDLDCPICDEDRIQAGTEIQLLRIRLKEAQNHINYLIDKIGKGRSIDRLGEVGTPPRLGGA